MSRYYIDCREHPGDVKCTVALAADSREELLEAVVEHGRAVHGYEDTPEFRNQIMQGMKEGTPPLVAGKAEAA
jgi:predicted small metal-binding protein